MAHITGGGLEDNVPRMLPKHLAAQLDAATWAVPSAMKWLKQAGKLSRKEFARTWNTGLGMILVVHEENVQRALTAFSEAGEKPLVVGKLINREGESVVLQNTELWD